MTNSLCLRASYKVRLIITSPLFGSRIAFFTSCSLSQSVRFFNDLRNYLLGAGLFFRDVLILFRAIVQFPGTSFKALPVTGLAVVYSLFLACVVHLLAVGSTLRVLSLK